MCLRGAPGGIRTCSLQQYSRVPPAPFGSSGLRRLKDANDSNLSLNAVYGLRILHPPTFMLARQGVTGGHSQPIPIPGVWQGWKHERWRLWGGYLGLPIRPGTTQRTLREWIASATRSAG